MGWVKEKYYNEKKIDVLARLIERMLNDLYVEGFLKHKVKVSVTFEDMIPARGVEFKLEIELLK